MKYFKVPLRIVCKYSDEKIGRGKQNTQAQRYMVMSGEWSANNLNWQLGSIFSLQLACIHYLHLENKMGDTEQNVKI